MKLIIDIPRSEYMKIKRYYDGLPEYSTVEAETYYIAHGIPLDDVKADVINIADGRQSIKVRSVLRILDRICEESEESEETDADSD